MSEDTFPFAEGDEGGRFDGQDGQRNKRAVVLVAGVAAAVVLGSAGYFLLGGGGGSQAANSAFVLPARAARVTAPRAVAAPEAQKLPVAYHEQIGRDPFRALYVVPVAAAEPAPAAAAPAAPAAALPVSPVQGSLGAAGPSSGMGTTPLAPVTPEYKLVLNRVYGSGTDRTGVFTIQGRQQVAKVGTKFGPTSEIILLSFQQGPKVGQWTTVLQVGDGDPFDVVSGVASYVR